MYEHGRASAGLAQPKRAVEDNAPFALNPYTQNSTAFGIEGA